jgi:thioesterase domain-containing protein
LQALQWIAEESAPRCVEEIAARYCTYILEGLSPGKHLVLYGASSGGLIALEMAHRLSAMGRSTALVVLADTRDDLKHKAPALGVLFDRLLWICLVELYLPPELLDLRPANHPFWSMGEDDRLDYLIARAGRISAPSVVPLQHDRLKVLLAAYRRYFHSYAGYTPPRYTGPALYIMGSAVSGCYSEKVRSQLQGYQRLAHVDGGHTAVLEPPGTSRIAKLIVEEMHSRARHGA